MTRADFLARFVIQHLNVERAVKFADSLEEHDGFEGWDDEEDSEDVVRLVTEAERAAALLDQEGTLEVRTAALALRRALRRALEPFVGPAEGEDAPETDG